MYGNVPNKKRPNEVKSSLWGSRTGFFKFVNTIDPSGRSKIELVEHVDPYLGLIFKKNENGEVTINHYAEAEALLLSEKTHRPP